MMFPGLISLPVPGNICGGHTVWVVHNNLILKPTVSRWKRELFGKT